MKKEMLINVLQPEECRIAIIEDGVLEELYVERTSHESYTGNIYKGRIVNLEPAIQAAFVDFSVGRNGFLHVSDIEPQYFDRNPPGPDMPDAGDRDRRRERGRDRERGRGRDDRRRAPGPGPGAGPSSGPGPALGPPAEPLNPPPGLPPSAATVGSKSGRASGDGNPTATVIETESGTGVETGNGPIFRSGAERTVPSRRPDGLERDWSSRSSPRSTPRHDPNRHRYNRGCRLWTSSRRSGMIPSHPPARPGP